MAIGFPAYYETVIPHNLSEQWAFCIARDALFNMGWREWVDYKFNNKLDYKSHNMMMTLGERMLIHIKENTLEIRSESALFTQFLDFGKNERNVNQFIETFNTLTTQTEE